MFRRESEKRTEKRDLAGILHNEIYRILNIQTSREPEQMSAHARHMSKMTLNHNSLVYQGILQTGNIRFFIRVLQNDLAEWYDVDGNFQFRNINHRLGIDIIKNLEDMEEKNKEYLKVFRISQLVTYLKRKLKG